jgi:hypothetical protein
MVEASKVKQPSLDTVRDFKKILLEDSRERIEEQRQVNNEFDGYHFCFTGTFSMPRHTIEKLVKDHGGAAVHQITPGTHFLVTSNDALDIKSKKLKSAIGYHTRIVREDLIYDALKLGGLDQLKIDDYLLTLDASDREIKHPPKPKVRKPDADYDVRARVERDGLGNYYDIVLKNDRENKECRMQILHDHGAYHLFIKYRTMLHGGITKFTHGFKTLEGAVQEFESKFSRKTGNEWSNYVDGQFIFLEGKYDLDSDYKTEQLV